MFEEFTLNEVELVTCSYKAIRLEAESCSRVQFVEFDYTYLCCMSRDYKFYNINIM